MDPMTATGAYRFCVQTHLFNVDRFILPMLDNCGPHVERIYVARSERPWRYNEKYRDLVVNQTPASILDESKWRDKIVLIEDEWSADEDQRNACLARAKADGMDYMVVQDADEYLTHRDYAANLAAVAANPDYDAYMMDCMIFWKSTEYIMRNRFGGDLDVDKKLFVLNCNTDVTFYDMRSVNEAACNVCPDLLPGLMYHLSYVMSDEELHKKLSVWGHTNDFDWATWYNEKWLKWYESRRLLGLRKGRSWARAKRYSGELPEVLDDFNNPEVTRYSPGLKEWLSNQVCGLALLAYYRWFRMPGRRLRRRLGLDKERFKQSRQMFP